MVQVERAHRVGGTWICCVPCYWLHRSKSVHKALLTFAMLLVTSLLVTSPVLFLITTLPDGDQPRDCSSLDDACIRERDGQDGVCEIGSCREASKRMLASMNRDVNPCDDFYQFACGSFRDRDPSSSFNSLQAQVNRQIQKILANETGKMTGVFEKLGVFYSTCVSHGEKTVNFTPVYKVLDHLGGYLPPKSPSPTDLTPLVGRLLRVNGAPLFDLHLDVDLYDHSRMSVFLNLPSQHLTETFYNNKQDDGPRWRQALKTSKGLRRKRNLSESRAYTAIKSAKEEIRCRKIEKIIENFLPEGMDKREKSYETYLLMQFCFALSKIYPRQKDLYSWVDVDQRVYVPYNLSYLQESFSYIRWKMLVNTTLSGSQESIPNNNGFKDENHLVYVYVTAPRYFQSLGKLLNQFSKRIVHNGLLFLYAVDTLYDLVNVTDNSNWNVFCSKLTKNIFPEMVGAVYVQQYKRQYLETLADRVNALFERIKETLAERILVMSWLDDDTRAQVLLKLTELQAQFHVWPGFYNKTLLAREMSEVHIDTDNFFENVIKRFQQIRRLDGRILRKSFGNRWRHPYTVNAYYEASSNSIVIPLALMAAWSWSADYAVPAYAAHATLGGVIAHEILHAFDLHRQLPLDSTLPSKNWIWITPESWNKLELKIECVAKFYAKRFWKKVQFYGDQVDVQFDWNVTRNENIADIGALQISYQTWFGLTNGKDRTFPNMEALRPSQLFFISAAQTYCSNMTAEAYILSVELDYHIPPPERVNVVMMNSPAFAEAFRCHANTRMNPSNKCSTW